MNRQQRRALRVAAARMVPRGTLTAPTPASVRLVGGPMDGWVVKPDAPALRADWWTTWPLRIAAKWDPGAYGAPVDRAGIAKSSWGAV